MPTDYDKIYRASPNALGPAFAQILEWFQERSQPLASLTVLDLGCGQGRDAIPIAQMGHRVHGVDLSPTGIEQMLARARALGLDVTGQVADLTDFRPQTRYDCILIDRTLHMLAPRDRIELLQASMDALFDQGTILIADEAKNIPAFVKHLANDHRAWRCDAPAKGLIFVTKG